MRNMTSRLREIVVIALLMMNLFTGILLSESSNNPLRKITDIPLPGAAVRFDYQTIDTSKGRLYIAHMNANQLVVSM